MNHCQKTEQAVKVQCSETPVQRGCDLLWLLPLLTGEASGTDSFFASAFINERAELSRAGLIKETLSSIAPLIRRSRVRTEQRLTKGRFSAEVLPPPSWSAVHEVSEEQVQKALLRVDPFPRCVLLLILFEHVPMQELSVLLGATEDLIQSVHQLALIEMTRNIALEQGWSPTMTSRESSAAIPVLTCQ